MRTARSPSRNRRRSAQKTPFAPALLAPAALATALVATAAVGVIAGRPVAVVSTAGQAAIEARTVVAGKAPTPATRTPGWRVVAAVGPSNDGVTGRVSASSATEAWSVWTGTAFTAVERLDGARWSRVPLPAALTGYARSAVAFGGDSATDFWLFSSLSPTRVVRFADGKWTVAPIPSWVLQRPSGSGGPSVTAAVFAPDDVWVFGLDAAAYAAHYDGRGWAKVRLPAAPDAVTAVSPDDIWAQHANEAWHWNGAQWTAGPIPKTVRNPPDRLGDVTVAGPGGARVRRSVRLDSVAWIPGTHSAWGTGTGRAGERSYGVLMKYGA
jgi:hypothetical protein